MEIPYLDYCGLTEKPFGITPDPFFYFESRSYREAIDHLRFFLDQKEGFALVYGDVGLGKTTLSRIFLDGLNKDLYHTALILNPIMDEVEFLRQVLKELSCPTYTYTQEEMLENLRDFLLDEYRLGKETVVVIDEAQLLSDKLFEFVRVLSNFETDKEKIVHIILFGQPEIIGKLTQANMRYLAQRITVIYNLKPLNHDEVFLYINHRMLRAGSRGFIQFTDDAVKHIFMASLGCPRLINVVCDRCLIYLYSHSKRTVDGHVVKHVLKEESVALFSKGKRDIRKIAYVAGLCAILVLLGFLLRPALSSLTKIFHNPSATTQDIQKTP